MFKGASIQAHELSQVRGVVVLLQELKEKTASYSERVNQLLYIAIGTDCTNDCHTVTDCT